jgi:cobalt-zinc-cadmium efflux system protein
MRMVTAMGGHEGHSHGVSADANSRKLAVALGLIVGFMVVEVATEVIAHSPALLSDAAQAMSTALRRTIRARHPVAGLD